MRERHRATTTRLPRSSRGRRRARRGKACCARKPVYRGARHRPPLGPCRGRERAARSKLDVRQQPGATCSSHWALARPTPTCWCASVQTVDAPSDHPPPLLVRDRSREPPAAAISDDLQRSSGVRRNSAGTAPVSSPASACAGMQSRCPTSRCVQVLRRIETGTGGFRHRSMRTCSCTLFEATWRAR